MSAFLFLFLLILLIVVSALCAGIINGMYSLNHYQLRRKAQLGDKDAKVVYPIHALKYQLLLTLLIINIASNATIAILIDSKTSGLIAILFTTIFILIFGEIIPMIYLRKYVIYITARIAPILKKIVTIMSPVTKPVAKILEDWIGSESQIFYSKDELLKIFDDSHLSKESSIPNSDIKMLKNVLRFSEKKIRDVMTPRRMVNLVAQDDEVGPILMDELHKSGHSRFPVVADNKHSNFVGTLFIRDLVGETGTKKVKGLMSKDVKYIHEEESLEHALKTFLKTRHHLFVVVNNFEEFVGVISIEDALEEVIGKEIVDEFDKHDDLRAVAKSIAEKEAKSRKN